MKRRGVKIYNKISIYGTYTRINISVEQIVCGAKLMVIRTDRENKMKQPAGL